MRRESFAFWRGTSTKSIFGEARQLSNSSTIKKTHNTIPSFITTQHGTLLQKEAHEKERRIFSAICYAAEIIDFDIIEFG
jgi:hypothetical protein